MKSKLLFPNRFIKIGFTLIGLVSLLLLYVNIFGNIKFLTHFPVFCIYDSGFFSGKHVMEFIHDDVLFELASIMFVLGSIFIGFSKQKSEDEFTANIRLESLLWTMYVLFALFLLSIMFIYGWLFAEIHLGSIFAFLVIFNLRFYYILYKSKRASKDEKQS